MNALSPEILKVELERRKQEQALLREQQRDQDPLTWYNANPIEDYTDPKGMTYRLGPSKTQLACMMDTSLYRILEGPNRGGKTIHLLCECAAYARGLHPARPWTIPPRILVLITTRQQAKSVWQDRLLEKSKVFGPAESYPLIPEWEIADRTKKRKDIDYVYMGSTRVASRIGLKNGAEIYFYWSGAADAWTRIEGMDFDAVFRDESNKDGNTGDQLMAELKLRLLDAQCHPDKPHAGFMLWGATDTKASSEFKEYRQQALSGMPDWGYHKIGPDENPVIGIEARKKMANAMNDDDAKVRLFGEGGYGDRFKVLERHFDPERNVLKEPYQPTATDNLFIFLDPAFGKTGSKHGIILAAIRRDEKNVLRIIAENARANCAVSEQVEIMIGMLNGVGRNSIESIVMDPAAAKTESTGESVYFQYMKELMRRGVTVHGGMVLGRNRKDDTYPMIITALREGRVLINPECVMLISQICEARSKDPTKYSGPQGVIDKKLDVLAAFRYGVSRNLFYIDRGNQPMTAPKAEAPDDPLVVTDEMDAYQRQHVNYLRMSADRASRMIKRNPFMPMRRIR